MRRKPNAHLNVLEQNVVRSLRRHSLSILRISLGVIYLWFGALKFFPGLSPAEDLALDTIDMLTLGLLPAVVSQPLLALLECAIGVGFLTGRYLRLTLALMAFQMAGAPSPLVLFPKETFGPMLIAPTLEGQYIFKNLVPIFAGLVIASSLPGGTIGAEVYGRGQRARAEREWEAVPVHRFVRRPSGRKEG